MHTDIIIGEQFAVNNNYWVMQVSPDSDILINYEIMNREPTEKLSKI